MADPDTVLAKADDRIANNGPLIDQVEEQFFSESGRFYQALPVHSQTPADGNERVPDRLDRKPTDEFETPNEVATRLGVDMPSPNMSNWHVNVYDGPLGQGYEMVFEHVIAGVRHHRTINRGPETWREHDWIEIMEETP